MNIRQLCRPNPVTVRAIDDLSSAAQLMREKHVGYLVVVEPGAEEQIFKPVGVLTDRDIVVTVVARGIDPNTLRVEDVMTPQPVVALETEPLETVLPRMRRMGVRRMPVVGFKGELLGVLSIDDVLDTIAGELQNVAGAIRSEQVIEGALRT